MNNPNWNKPNEVNPYVFCHNCGNEDHMDNCVKVVIASDGKRNVYICESCEDEAKQEREDWDYFNSEQRSDNQLYNDEY